MKVKLAAGKLQNSNITKIGGDWGIGTEKAVEVQMLFLDTIWVDDGSRSRGVSMLFGVVLLATRKATYSLEPLPGTGHGSDWPEWGNF